jgi:hypothetical protein
VFLRTPGIILTFLNIGKATATKRWAQGEIFTKGGNTQKIQNAIREQGLI